MRVDLEVFSTDGHLEGRLIPRDGREPRSFSGVLEFLAAIENLDPEPLETTRTPPATPDSEGPHPGQKDEEPTQYEA